MNLYLQACGGVLIGLILVLILGSKGKESAVLLTIMVCCMAVMVAMGYLKPILDFLNQLQDLGGLNSEMVSILLKAAGIGLLSEISALICADSGNASMGKSLQILGCAVILWLSLPLFTMLMEVLKGILGEI